LENFNNWKKIFGKGAKKFTFFIENFFQKLFYFQKNPEKMKKKISTKKKI